MKYTNIIDTQSNKLANTEEEKNYLLLQNENTANTGSTNTHKAPVLHSQGVVFLQSVAASSEGCTKESLLCFQNIASNINTHESSMVAALRNVPLKCSTFILHVYHFQYLPSLVVGICPT